MVKTLYNSSIPDGSPAWIRATMLAHGCVVTGGIGGSARDFTSVADAFIVSYPFRGLERTGSAGYLRSRRAQLSSAGVDGALDFERNTVLTNGGGNRGLCLAPARFQTQLCPCKLLIYSLRIIMPEVEILSEFLFEFTSLK